MRSEFHSFDFEFGINEDSADADQINNYLQSLFEEMENFGIEVRYYMNQERAGHLEASRISRVKLFKVEHDIYEVWERDFEQALSDLDDRPLIRISHEVDERYPMWIKDLSGRAYRDWKVRIEMFTKSWNEWHRVINQGLIFIVNSLKKNLDRQDYESLQGLERFRHEERIEEIRLESERVKLQALKFQAESVDKHQITLKEVESRLRIAESQNIQPIEVQKLLIQAMGRYGEMREKALDESIRNPSLEEKFKTRAAAYLQMQQQTVSLQGLLNDPKLTSEQRNTFIDQYVKQMSQDAERQLKEM